MLGNVLHRTATVNTNQCFIAWLTVLHRKAKQINKSSGSFMGMPHKCDTPTIRPTGRKGPEFSPVHLRLSLVRIAFL